ncbi:hypothetical protein [Streptomyces sp. NEAU-YJ-81]|nr:hypothetical protein [Streptomyces sp. NEAU-YJ-81]
MSADVAGLAARHLVAGAWPEYADVRGRAARARPHPGQREIH